MLLRRHALCLIAALPVGLLAAGPAAAQVHRNFPAEALRGEMVFVQAPDVTLNGKPARLSPGSRIRGDTNLLVMSGTLAGQKHIVHYTIEPGGLVSNVWILNPAELANKRWPRTREEAAQWQFDGAAQIWTKP